MPARASLSARHHTLIQALLSRGPLKESEFHSMFHKVTGKYADDQLFKSYLTDINDELDYAQLELRKCLNQYDGKAYYGVVNTVSDEHSKFGTTYTVPQIALYKGVIEAIVQDAAGEGSISNIDALNIRLENQIFTGTDSQSQNRSNEIPSVLKNFSMSQKDKTLEQFVHDQWLCSIPDGRIGLGIRSFLDLRSWFHDNEVPKCHACNEAAVKAEFCKNEDCTTWMHKSCLKKFSGKRGCPNCGTQWLLSAKREATEEQEDDQDGPSENPSQPDSSVRKKRKASKGDGPSQNLSQPDRSVRKRLNTSRGVDHNTQESDSTVTNSSSGSRRVTRSSTRLSAA